MVCDWLDLVGPCFSVLLAVQEDQGSRTEVTLETLNCQFRTRSVQKLGFIFHCEHFETLLS